MSSAPPELPSTPPPGPAPAAPAAVADARPVPPPRSRLRRAALTVLTALAVLTTVASLVLLASTAQDSHLFNELQPWLLLINAAGVLVLLALIARKLYELARDFRAQVPGSRLTMRTVLMSARW